ncbi:hypothetical protein SAMN02799630_05431 [Paenibacillus sp. UNCCL117]|uniref:hypothetical protein n=1 Tax=unclassified Paenibacillus TaxID=185978 RepID=UPI000883BF63|nr:MULTISPECIES: hypothetical protein [unclassified Paenibacillus]SDE46712.1 hypothetical protein SAMN04488602_12935 [Paenibacillus sp. cl123]SFW65803.1 hypothetical protein SAMN02799630_05431 [Paenibacillus sp. UNCCL117]
MEDIASVYLNLLQRWMRSAPRYIHNCQDRPELACYGSGENGWGVQTNQKALAAIAVLSANAGLNPAEAGSSREELKSLALRLLRFSLQSHLEGDYHCTDGTSWGHTWISALGIERMMHGVEALWPGLTEADRLLLRRVLLSECDWLLEHYEVVAGLYNHEGRNKPESNLWNGALLHRTADMYPDSPHAACYREKGTIFLMNAVSVPSDEWNETVKDGRKVADWFVGANFFESYALHHHGYLNVGYMVICLSNMAMLHFAFKQRGSKPPEALYHRMRGLWEVVKLCTFPDGRLLRIGGDTRVRYTYCQDYVIPVWHMVKDALNEPDCDRFEAGWLEQIRLEMDANGDDTFLSARCGPLAQSSPLYYTRLESDRAAALSMGLVWRSWIGRGEAAAQPEEDKNEDKEEARASVPAIRQEEGGACSWHDAYHGAYLHRDANRIASWVWEAAEKPQGLCIPAHASDMAEWRENLSVRLSGLGRITSQRLERHDGVRFPGGFLTWGSLLVHTEGLLAEGQADYDVARSQLVCAALPDGKHMLVLQYATALERRTYMREVKGLHLLIPNDLFNGSKRTYVHGKGAISAQGSQGDGDAWRTGSRWLNADDRLGVIAVYGTDELSVYRPVKRQIGLKEKPNNIGMEGMLYADEICGPIRLGLQVFEPHQVIADAGYVLQAGERNEGTAAYAGSEQLLTADAGSDGTCRSVRIRGADGELYVLAANFGEVAAAVHFEGSEGRELASGETTASGADGLLKAELQPGTARLWRLR